MPLSGYSESRRSGGISLETLDYIRNGPAEKKKDPPYYGKALYSFDIYRQNSLQSDVVGEVKRAEEVELLELNEDMIKLKTSQNTIGWAPFSFISSDALHWVKDTTKPKYSDSDMRQAEQFVNSLKPKKTKQHGSVSYSDSDMRQAEQFVNSLPAACSSSYITTKSDGTVVIHLKCRKGNDSTTGIIEIKNGVVKKIR